MRAFAALLGGAFASASPTFYVDCSSGSDSGAGSSSSPWFSLFRAQTAVRAAPAGATVYIRGDCYPRDASGAFDGAGSLLTLGPADSGSPGSPVKWAAWPGAPAPPRLLGGVAIPASAWSPAGAAAPTPGTLMADLGAGGVNVARWGLGSLAGNGLGQCVDTMAELFFNGAPQFLARYPNVDPSGAWEWLGIEKVADKENAFYVNGTGAAHALTWPAATDAGGSAWVHGFWSYDWADSYCEVKSVVSDGAGGAEITIAPTTPPVYGFLPKARFYGVNILAELDVAGEYFIDSFKEVIYWMPPPGGVSAADEVVLSVAHTLVNNSAPVAHVVFSGLHALYARGTGFSLQGLENVSLVGITSALHGHTGFSLSGYGVTLRDSTVYGTGCAAADVTGGDLMQLLPSGNFVINNSMHDYARIIRTYNPGLMWFGAVGQTMANNTFRNAPHNGMLGGGALNLVEGNLFDTLLYEATDSGAFYVGYSWTQRGNVVRGNTFRNIRATEKTMLGYPSVQAIHLDDQQSGYVLENNVCENSTTCFLVGGGRDVIVRNNICRHTGRCLHLDNRGMYWQHDSCVYNATWTGRLIQELFDVNYTHPPYSTAFPEIVDTLSRRMCEPVNVSFTGNFGCDVSQMIDVSLEDLADWGDVYAGNTNATTC